MSSQPASQRLQDDFLELVFVTRERLENLYGSPLADAEKRRKKSRIFINMRSRYRLVKARWDGDGRYDHWFANGLNNARLASVVTYHDLAPGFDAMLARHDGDLAAFYAEVEALAEQPREERRRRLADLGVTRSAKAEPQAATAASGHH